mmetsp:Transcript_1768/g.4472  ORF Transcript_1768/g.4472 Transcript_1768/m.4472 type:complete len:285 (+) Transcript_1768:1300-2154(+)
MCSAISASASRSLPTTSPSICVSSSTSASSAVRTRPAVISVSCGGARRPSVAAVSSRCVWKSTCCSSSSLSRSLRAGGWTTSCECSSALKVVSACSCRSRRHSSSRTSHSARCCFCRSTSARRTRAMSCACTSRLARMSRLISKTCSSAIRSSAGGSSCAVSMSESSSFPSSSSVIARRSPSTPCRSTSKSVIHPSRRAVCSCSRSHPSFTSTSSISSRNSSAISSKMAWISSSLSVSSFLKPRPACPVRVSRVTSMAATFLPYAWIASSCFAFRVICISLIPA